MLRNIVVIDEEKCDGCGLCVKACAEGAIQIINGKAKLVSETYCDGLGACLGHCPRGAITIEQRRAAAFDEKAAHEHVNRLKAASEKPFSGCPGMKMMQRKPQETVVGTGDSEIPSQLGQWPVQLKLLSPTAPYFAQADLMLVADCVPFAMGDFHPSLLKGHTIAVGCPKLDDRQYYVEKVSQILRLNDIRSLTVVRMEVPCCSGLTQIARTAVADSGKAMPFEEITISLNGQIIQRKTHPA
ncbi:MAG TPA: 4Fe-4S binding protein [Anaerohalosphaeraceae bacterium]|nr:4Fe-4S binding protein [Anaerohalosphaeraceae bacterium]